MRRPLVLLLALALLASAPASAANFTLTSQTRTLQAAATALIPIFYYDDFSYQDHVYGESLTGEAADGGPWSQSLDAYFEVTQPFLDSFAPSREASIALGSWISASASHTSSVSNKSAVASIASSQNDGGGITPDGGAGGTVSLTFTLDEASEAIFSGSGNRWFNLNLYRHEGGLNIYEEELGSFHHELNLLPGTYTIYGITGVDDWEGPAASSLSLSLLLLPEPGPMVLGALALLLATSLRSATLRRSSGSTRRASSRTRRPIVGPSGSRSGHG